MKLSELLFEDIYCSGLCAEFAVALHNVFGYPLYEFSEVTIDPDYDEQVFNMIHVFCKKDNVGIDSKGVRPIDEIRQELFSSSNPEAGIMLRKTSVAELDAQGMEGLYQEEIKKAEDHIRKNRKQYEAR